MEGDAQQIPRQLEDEPVLALAEVDADDAQVRRRTTVDAEDSDQAFGRRYDWPCTCSKRGMLNMVPRLSRYFRWPQ